MAITSPPPGWDTSGPTPDQGPTLIIWSVVLSALGAIFVALRLTSKLCFYKTLHLEDYYLIIALVMSLIFNNFTLICTKFGLGRHVWDASPRDQVLFKKFFMPCIWSFAGAHWAVKLSFVAFYKRIYYKHRFKTFINIVYGLLMVIYATYFVIHCIPCIPLNKYWDSSVEGFCFDARADYESLGIVNCIWDIAILLLPIPIVRQAKVKTEGKLTLVMVFGIGLFCCITSLLRVVLSLQNFNGGPEDLSWNITNVMIWSMVEISVGIVVCCMLQLNRLCSWVFAKIKSARGGSNGSLSLESHELAKNTFFSSGKPGKGSRRGNMTVDIENAIRTLATVDNYGTTNISAGVRSHDDDKNHSNYRSFAVIVESEARSEKAESHTEDAKAATPTKFS